MLPQLHRDFFVRVAKKLRRHGFQAAAWLGIVAAFAACGAERVHAFDRWWNYNNTSPLSWNVGSHWTPSGLPTALDNAHFGDNTSSIQVNPSVPNIDQLIVGGPWANGNYYSLAPNVSLFMNSGAILNSNKIHLGAYSVYGSIKGNLTISGPGDVVTKQVDLYEGSSLTISNGGLLQENQFGIFAGPIGSPTFAGPTAQITVTGVGSNLLATSIRSTTGLKLTVSNGGLASFSGTAYNGNVSGVGGDGDWLVTGAGSLLATASTVVGYVPTLGQTYPDHKITVADRGVMTTGNLIIYSTTSGANRVVLSNGLLNAGTISQSGPNARIEGHGIVIYQPGFLQDIGFLASAPTGVVNYTAPFSVNNEQALVSSQGTPTIGPFSLEAGQISGNFATALLAGDVTHTTGAVTGTARTSFIAIPTLDFNSQTRTFYVAADGAAVDLSVTGSITNGGLLKSGSGVLQLAQANMQNLDVTAGKVLVQGAGNGITTTAAITVNGGILEVRSGAGVNLASAVISSGGLMSVSGDSTVGSSGAIFVGEGGSGALRIESGATVANAGAQIGPSAGTFGSVFVDGTGSHWNNGGNSLRVGNSGNADLQIQAGGMVTSSTVTVAHRATSTATAAVTGAGSQWSTPASMYIGGDAASAGGTATVTIASGGTLDVGARLRNWETGTLIVEGGNVVAGELDNRGVLQHKDGTITVEGGAYTHSYAPGGAPLVLNGATAGANPKLVLTNDVDSSASLAGVSSLTVGDNRRGTLEVRNGSQVGVAGPIVLGNTSGGRGTMLITGSGSAVLTSASFTVGRSTPAGDAAGFLTVENQGSATATGGFVVGGAGVLTVNNASVTGDVAVRGALVGQGAVVTTSSGSSIPNFVVGNVVSTGGYISGNLQIVGDLTFQNLNGTDGYAGTMAPGNSPGGIWVEGDLTLASGTAVAFDLNGSAPSTSYNGQNDLVIVGGDLTLNGELSVTETSPGSFLTADAGDRWTLFAYLGNLIDETLDFSFGMPTLANGLSFSIDTSMPGQVDLLVVSAVPEAGAWMFGTVATALVVVKFRRRRAARRHAHACPQAWACDL